MRRWPSPQQGGGVRSEGGRRRQREPALVPTEPARLGGRLTPAAGVGSHGRAAGAAAAARSAAAAGLAAADAAG